MKPLRKRHLQVWVLFAFLIPFGIISAYIALQKTAFNKLLPDDKTAALPVVIRTVNGKDCFVYMRSSPDKNSYQLQWINTKVSTLPSSLIYQLNTGEKQLIGRVESTGSYYFPLKKDTAGRYNFILYDIIHQQVIDTIKF